MGLTWALAASCWDPGLACSSGSFSASPPPAPTGLSGRGLTCPGGCCCGTASDCLPAGSSRSLFFRTPPSWPWWSSDPFAAASSASESLVTLFRPTATDGRRLPAGPGASSPGREAWLLSFASILLARAFVRLSFLDTFGAVSPARSWAIATACFCSASSFLRSSTSSRADFFSSSSILASWSSRSAASAWRSATSASSSWTLVFSFSSSSLSTSVWRCRSSFSFTSPSRTFLASAWFWGICTPPELNSCSSFAIFSLSLRSSSAFSCSVLSSASRSVCSFSSPSISCFNFSDSSLRRSIRSAASASTASTVGPAVSSSISTALSGIPSISKLSAACRAEARNWPLSSSMCFSVSSAVLSSEAYWPRCWRSFSFSAWVFARLFVMRSLSLDALLLSAELAFSASSRLAASWVPCSAAWALLRIWTSASRATNWLRRAVHSFSSLAISSSSGAASIPPCCRFSSSSARRFSDTSALISSTTCSTAGSIPAVSVEPLFT
mmetsp:Transcript_20014/g.44505  ORF Transcript_20014/g.44505 Transcript_20014/m.44505 type:complete len:497 (+) Transcript_20014:935-2425(+)